MRDRFVCGILLLLLGGSARLAAHESPVHWEQDASLTGIVHGAIGVWHDKLWGLDADRYRIWTYNGNTFSNGPALPVGYKPIRATFADDGMYLFAREPHKNAPTTLHLMRSPDGIQPFTDLMARDVIQSIPLEQSVVDLGQGRLLYVDYGNDDELFYSDNQGTDWRVLLVPNQKAVRHFHGAFFDEQYGKLYLMSGDSESESSIMVADDLFGENGLINNPTLWAARWGLLDAGRTTANPQYILNPDGFIFSQRSRAVEMVPYGDYLYWGEDSGHQEGQAVFRVHRHTQQVEQVGERGIPGVIWNWLVTDDNRLLMTTGSVHYGDGLIPGNDEFVRLYSFNEAGTQFAEVTRFARNEPYYDSAVAVGFVEAFGRLWLNGYEFPSNRRDIVGRLVANAPRGDLDIDGQLTAADVTMATNAIRSGILDTVFDFNRDGHVNWIDREAFIHETIGTWYGDADLDGQFDSHDLILVMQHGEYEDHIAGNSDWSEGDWDGDQEFTTADFIRAFQDGGYGLGLRSAVAMSVPEPVRTGSIGFLLLAVSRLWSQRRRQAPEL